MARRKIDPEEDPDAEEEEREDEGDGVTLDPLVASTRADPRSRFYDPRYARPIASQALGWGEIDMAVLEESRGAVPAFPLDPLPAFWRDWVQDTARASCAPVDFVAQSLLAAVAGLAGAGAVVRVGPRWSEPLVLWQALVGAPSSGKSASMTPMRELLATLAREAAGDESPPVSFVADAWLGTLADGVAAHPRGVVLWGDDAPEWLDRAVPGRRSPWLNAWSALPLSLGQGATGKSVQRIERFAVSLLLACRPDRLDGLLKTDQELASRFLFAWPPLPELRPLATAKPAQDEAALAALSRIARRVGKADDPLALIVDERGTKALDEFLSGLQAELREAEGLEMAWLGKGRGVVVRLAGMLELLAWSALGSASPPGHLGREQIERAVRLWSGYFRPHAHALFDRAAPTDRERQARRVARWLRHSGLDEVTREQVRLDALGRSLNADETEQVLYRLQNAGMVQKLHFSTPSRGRPPNRWAVSPRLASKPSAGNAGNAGK